MDQSRQKSTTPPAAGTDEADVPHVRGTAAGDSSGAGVAPADRERWTDDPPTATPWREPLINVVRGFCMGVADTVPGVSGGTVALVLGHYERLVTAISRIDSTLLSLLRQGRLREAARHVDFLFLLMLGLGLGIGAGSMAGVMHWLLEHQMPATFAVFLGLLAASVWIVQRSIDRWDAAAVVALLAGIATAVGITMLPAAPGNMSLPFLFVAATIAICAMILPGISGAFVLLLLGVYHEVTGLIKDAARLQISAESLVQIATFGAGCLVGLLAFSRILRWLLQHYHRATMAGLTGLMVGSIGKLWPLQMPTPQTADLEWKARQMRYVAPEQWPGSLTVLVLLAIAAAIAVLAIERWATEAQRSR